MSKDEKFVYSYSAKQKKEIEEIRTKYLPKTENKLDKIRKLDESATRKATIQSIVVGLISSLIFGFGLCCVLVWKDSQFIQGIIIGIVGLCGMLLALPLYSHILKVQRNKISEKIISLSDELIDEMSIKNS
ncbi:hypothetical protein [uncultured Intestinibacter sp.]|jgi:hypothetical protein|uniref:hypothetical protein n=1 Tax=uncultured Intestinibacter sp. TaxID=1505659 RepID=UPI0027DC752F|nr:hypothetical protein [uncultured Intestinibacter sp.]